MLFSEIVEREVRAFVKQKQGAIKQERGLRGYFWLIANVIFENLIDLVDKNEIISQNIKLKR